MDTIGKTLKQKTENRRQNPTLDTPRSSEMHYSKPEACDFRKAQTVPKPVEAKAQNLVGQHGEIWPAVVLNPRLELGCRARSGWASGFKERGLS